MSFIDDKNMLGMSMGMYLGMRIGVKSGSVGSGGYRSEGLKGGEGVGISWEWFWEKKGFGKMG
jgi:hypothetical protein